MTECISMGLPRNCRDQRLQVAVGLLSWQAWDKGLDCLIVRYPFWGHPRRDETYLLGYTYLATPPRR